MPEFDRNDEGVDKGKNFKEENAKFDDLWTALILIGLSPTSISFC
jgi:hypothetical protein